MLDAERGAAFAMQGQSLKQQVGGACNAHGPASGGAFVSNRRLNRIPLLRMIPQECVAAAEAELGGLRAKLAEEQAACDALKKQMGEAARGAHVGAGQCV